MRCSPYFLVFLFHSFKHSHFLVLFHFILSIDDFLNVFMLLSEFFQSLWRFEIYFHEFLSLSIASPFDSWIYVLCNLLIFLVSFHDSVNSRFTMHNCVAFIDNVSIVQSRLIWHYGDVVIVMLRNGVASSSCNRGSVQRSLNRILLRALRRSQSSNMIGMMQWQIKIMRKWM